MRRRLEHPRRARRRRRGHARMPSRPRFEPAPPRAANSELRDALKQQSASRSPPLLLLVGAAGWCWLIYNEFVARLCVAAGTVSAPASPTAGVGKSNSFSHRPMRAAATAGDAPMDAELGGETPASRARSARLRRILPSGGAVRPRPPPASGAKIGAVAAEAPPRRRQPSASAKEPSQSPVRVASLDDAAPLHRASPGARAIPSRIRADIEAKTSLVDFETAPFPYHGTCRDRAGRSSMPAKRAIAATSISAAMFFGKSQTFSDDRVLLHIPPGFDPTRPAVMVVFFHGHGADSGARRARPAARAGADHGGGRQCGAGGAAICRRRRRIRAPASSGSRTASSASSTRRQ